MDEGCWKVVATLENGEEVVAISEVDAYNTFYHPQEQPPIPAVKLTQEQPIYKAIVSVQLNARIKANSKIVKYEITWEEAWSKEEYA